MQLVLHLVALFANMIAYGKQDFLAGANRRRVPGAVGRMAVGSAPGRQDHSHRQEPAWHRVFRLRTAQNAAHDGRSQSFLEDLRGRTIVMDEIHRLDNPSEILKIAADHYPETKILATGSSTFGASAKFKDTLAGRKYELWLTPLMSADLADFGNQASLIASAAAACLLSSLRKIIRSAIFRSGWNLTGLKTSRSFSGLRGGIHS